MFSKFTNTKLCFDIRLTTVNFEGKILMGNIFLELLDCLALRLIEKKLFPFLVILCALTSISVSSYILCIS